METSTAAITSWFQFVSDDQSATTDNNTSMSSSIVTSTDGQIQFDFGLLFRSVIILIGFVGILANGLVLIAMAASKEVKRVIIAL